MLFEKFARQKFFLNGNEKKPITVGESKARATVL